MIPSKKEEINYKSSTFKRFLFPSTLIIIESKYDTMHQGGLSISEPSANFQRFKNEIELENFNEVQMKMLFDILDVSYETFILRDWKEFNRLLSRVFNHNSEIIPDDLKFILDENYLNLVKEKIENLKKVYINNYKLLKDIYLKRTENLELEKISESDVIEENSFGSLFDEIRNNEYGKLKLYNIIKENTGLEIEPLNYLLSDLDLYLFIEKEEYECNISVVQIEKRIQQYNDQGLEIPYHKTTPLKDLTEKQIENRKKANLKIEPSINLESLMYPFEFYSLYEFKNILIQEITKHNNKTEVSNNETLTNPKLKTNLSVPELALLFKLLKDLKPNLFELKSEAELHRFISTNFETKKTGDNDISTQKLRILFNQPDSKAVDFWEANLRLLLADVKKLK